MQGSHVLNIFVYHVYIESVKNCSQKDKQRIGEVVKIDTIGTSKVGDEHTCKSNEYTQPLKPSYFQIKEKKIEGEFVLLLALRPVDALLKKLRKNFM